MQIEQLFYFATLFFSVILHEVSHGHAANLLGDPTARFMGRLTLNPFKHIDPLGSVIIPALSAMFPGNFLFGWAKPVPYNPYNLRAGRWGEAIVAAAGPGMNLFLAIVFGLIARMNVDPIITGAAFIVVIVNVSLALINLIPIPPLDGSKVLSSLLPMGLATHYDRFRQTLEWNPFLGFGLVLLVVMLFGNVLGLVVFTLASLITGIGL